MARKTFARLYKPDPGPQASKEQSSLFAPDDPGARRQTLLLTGKPLGPIGGGELVLKCPPGPAKPAPSLLDASHCEDCPATGMLCPAPWPPRCPGARRDEE